MTLTTSNVSNKIKLYSDLTLPAYDNDTIRDAGL